MRAKITDKNSASKKQKRHAKEVTNLHNFKNQKNLFKNFEEIKNL